MINSEKAFEWLEKAAEQGHVEAQYQLGMCYVEGKGVDQDWQKAIGWFEKIQDKLDSLDIDENEKAFVQNAVLAEKGDAEAQYKLGSIYYCKNRYWQKAVEWYTKAAEQGHEEAQYNLGYIYSDKNSYRHGINQDWQKAIEWYTKAAEQGHEEAQYKLGMCYAEGEGVDQDWQKAIGWFEKIQDKLDSFDKDRKAFVENAVLAEKGDAEAQYKLGNIYTHRYIVKHDWQKAIEWYTKAAEQGHAEAQYQLGMCYVKGEGVDQDWQKAIGWFEKIQDKLDALDIDEYKKDFAKNAVLAEKGDAEAQYQLGNNYSNKYGINRDWQKAIEWYTKAAEQGHAEAQYQLGMCYVKGEGVDQDWQKAIGWFEKIQDKLDSFDENEKAFVQNAVLAEKGDAEAQYQLGNIYSDNYSYRLGINYDWQRAVEWYTKAAEQGHAKAQYKLGMCCAKGEGVDQDWQKAVGWFEKVQDKLDSLDIAENEKAFVKNAVLAEKGDAEAQYLLGNIYSDFRYVYVIKHDWQKAIEWYTKAAEQGYAKAQYELGMCYVKGDVVEEDLQKAIGWFEKIQDKLDSLDITENEKAFIKNVLLAEKGDAEAQYLVGMYLLK